MAKSRVGTYRSLTKLGASSNLMTIRERNLKWLVGYEVVSHMKYDHVNFKVNMFHNFLRSHFIIVWVVVGTLATLKGC